MTENSFCSEAKYIESNLDLDYCLKCLETKKCFHDKPRFNSVKIKKILEYEVVQVRWKKFVGLVEAGIIGDQIAQT